MDFSAMAIFPLVVFAILITTGNLTTGPRLIDDNQIYKLRIELKESDFLRVVANDITSRLKMRRLVPVYCVHKVAQAAVFGGNLVLWSVWVGLIATLTGIFLFVFLRLSHFSVFEALAFSLITILGEQSVVSWRLLSGEGIGMLLLSGGMVCMALRARTGKLAFEIASTGLLSLSMLCKESFILVAPALLLWKVSLTRECMGTSVVAALRRSIVSIVGVGTVAAAALAIIVFGFSTTEFAYAGWTGFQADEFVRILKQYFWISDAWLLLALLGWLACARLQGTGKHKRSTGSGIFVALIWLTLTLPQLLLYMRTGLLGGQDVHYERYILPCMLGFSLLVAEALRRIRRGYGDRGRAYGLSVVLVCASLALDARVAWLGGRAYADLSRTNDSWMESIQAHVLPREPIVVVYSNLKARSPQVALRLYYILRERYGLEKIYFLPVPGSPTIEERRQDPILQEDTRHHARKMRTVEQLAETERVQAVLIPCHRFSLTTEELEEHLLGLEAPWFPVQDFERVVHPPGHISYFRSGTAAQVKRVQALRRPVVPHPVRGPWSPPGPRRRSLLPLPSDSATVSGLAILDGPRVTPSSQSKTNPASPVLFE